MRTPVWMSEQRLVCGMWTPHALWRDSIALVTQDKVTLDHTIHWTLGI